MLREIVRDAPQIRESRESLRARFEAFLSALRMEPYDPKTVAELLKEQQNVAVNRQEIGERLLLERLEAMSVSERNAYADALEQSFRRLKRPSD